jgi:DNA-binding NarL/FixJ family response regulator
MPPVLKILIVDDDATLRARFAGIVQSCDEFELIAAIDTVTAALAVLERIEPDVLLCDLGLPDGDGIDVLRAARQKYPALDALVITVFGDEAHVMRSLEAGAKGYLLKDSVPEDFIATIRELRAGGSPISPIIARRLLQRFGEVSRRQARDGVDLTEREKEVLQLVAKGYRAPEIAVFLKISHHTVATHIKKIYGKLEVSTRGEAVYEASRRRLI